MTSTRRLLTLAFAIAATAGIIGALVGQRDAAGVILMRPVAVPILLGGIAATGVGVLLGLWAWLSLVSGTGTPVPVRAGMRLFAVGFLGKFVPGRVWGVIAQAALGREVGVSRSRMAGIFVANLAVVLLTGSTVSLLVAPTLLGQGALWLSVPALVTVCVLLRPQLVNQTAVHLRRLLRRAEPGSRTEASRIRQAIVAQTLAWPIAGLHVWLLTILFGASPLTALPISIGGFALASIAGTAAVIAPDGVGVREVVLTAVLATILPLPDAALAAITSRLVCTVGEVLITVPMLFAHSRIAESRQETSHAFTA